MSLSEIRVNTTKTRTGVGTITYTETGPVITGIATASNFKTGSTNVHSTGVELTNINTGGATATFGGAISGTTASFSGTVSIGGTLTYEDVTNIDSVGILTARAGIKDSTLTSGRVTYAGSGGRLVDSANLTFDGNTLALNSSTGTINVSRNSRTLTLEGNYGNEGHPAVKTSSGHDLRIFTSGNNERVRINSSGKTFIHGGGATGANNTSTLLPNGNTLNIHGTSSNDGISVVRYSADYGAYGINIGKSNNSTFGTNTLVTDGEELGHVSFYGADGTNFDMAAQITAKVDGDPATGGDATDMPGALSFRTTAEGSDSPTERLRLKSDGTIKWVQHPTTRTNTVDNYTAEGGYIFHYVARTTSGADRYRRMFDIASVGDSTWGSAIRFSTNPDSNATTIERMRIDHNGKVGINESSPDALLHLKNIATAGITAGIRLESSGTNNNAGDTMGQLEFAHNDSNDAGVSATIKCVAEDNAGNTYLTFNNGNPGSVGERLRITSNGNVVLNSTVSSTGQNSGGIKRFEAGLDYWSGARGSSNAIKYGVHAAGDDNMYGMGISSSMLELQSQVDIGLFAGTAGSGTGRRQHRATLHGASGLFRFYSGTKLQIDAGADAHSLGLLNIGSNQGTNTETRAIDIEGSWSPGENKSIIFSHGTSSTQMVGAINSIHYGGTASRTNPNSGLRFGRLYHAGDSSTYTMTLDSSSITSADLTVKGAYRSSQHPAFSCAADSGQSNIGTTATKLTYNVPSTTGRNQEGFDTSNNRFVAPLDGVYHFYCRHWFTANLSGTVYLYMYRNGSQVKEARVTKANAPSEYSTIQLSTTLYLSATNYIEMYGKSSVNNGFHPSSGAFHTEFSGFLVC